MGLSMGAQDVKNPRQNEVPEGERLHGHVENELRVSVSMGRQKINVSMGK